MVFSGRGADCPRQGPWAGRDTIDGGDSNLEPTVCREGKAGNIVRNPDSGEGLVGGCASP